MAFSPENIRFGRSQMLLCLVLAAVTLAVYLQVGGHPFLDMDDNLYVTDNAHVTGGITGGNVLWAFTSVEAGNWHPVTWLSHMADVQLYGVQPRGHHLTNVAIHILGSWLLFLFLFRSTGSPWQSSLVAFLFALHPLHVESVAWVAERKDVLSAFFWFLTLLAYAHYSVERKGSTYILCLLFFLFGLMSKPMVVTLPLVMLLLDFWPFDRYRLGESAAGLAPQGKRILPLLREKVPFLALSLCSGLVTIYAQAKGGATSGLEAVPFLLRLENALVAYGKYLLKTLWPVDLAVLYPFSAQIPPWQVAGALVLLILLTTATVRVRHRFPFLVVGWLWFLVTLVPVIGLIQVGSQAMADRYCYLPSIGLFIMVAWGVPVLTARWKARKAILAFAAGAAVTASAALSWQQLHYWRGSVPLYRHTLQVAVGSYLVHTNLGAALAERGDLDGAIEQYRKAIILSPGNFNAHGNLGLALLQKGDSDGALVESRTAVRLSPDSMSSHYNLGVVLARKGDLGAAISAYREALRIGPDNPRVHDSLGTALINTGDLEGGIRELRGVLRMRPDDIDAHSNLGVALVRKGDLDGAIGEFRQVLGISPDDSFARNNLGRLLARQKGR